MLPGKSFNDGPASCAPRHIGQSKSQRKSSNPRRVARKHVSSTKRREACQVSASSYGRILATEKSSPVLRKLIRRWTTAEASLESSCALSLIKRSASAFKRDRSNSGSAAVASTNEGLTPCDASSSYL